MSALPKQVQKQIDAANRIAAQVYAKPGETPPVDPAATPPTPPTPPASEPASAPPPALASEAPAPETPPAPAAKLPVEEWEQKYKVLQGKYNAEVPRLQNTVRDQGDQLRRVSEQLTATQTLLASLGNQRGTAPADAPPPAASRLVKDEEIKEFGPDLYDFIKRAAAEAVLPQVDARFDSKLKPVAQQVEQAAGSAAAVAQRVERNDQQSVLSLLGSEVPNWQTQNEDPNFLAWLDQIDPYAGVMRGALLKQAYKAHDGPRVVAFFKGYQIEHAAVTPPAAPAAPSASTPPAAPQKRLEEFVAPGSPKPSAAGTQDGSGKRVWSRAEITKFYKDCQDGKYATPSKKDERVRLEADIFAAQREGRIR